jgi:glycosyltransferase involved in cell wall biosynthesis
LEHDPPWEDVTDQKHWFNDPNGLLVHVTHFNRLMWLCDHVRTRVIEHGVKVPETVRYSGELAQGITALNHLVRRGRKVGADIYQQLARLTPLELVGMAAEEAGGVGEIVPTELASFIARYRYFFSPIRYTSLGLAILEAMSIGMPIIGLATCELATVIENGRTGFLETDLDKLLEHMQRLTKDRSEAEQLGRAARQVARDRFNIRRFADDWQRTLWEVAGDSIPRRHASERISPSIAREGAVL